MSIPTTAASDPSTSVSERGGADPLIDPLERIKLVASQNREDLRELVHLLPRDDVDEMLVRLVGDWDDLAAQLFDYEETADSR